MIEVVADILGSVVSILLIAGVIYTVKCSFSYDSGLKKLEERVTKLEEGSKTDA